ncbi:MAG: hypothetical protein WEB06_17550 [Actinomycetota bacterium]
MEGILGLMLILGAVLWVYIALQQRRVALWSFKPGDRVQLREGSGFGERSGSVVKRRDFFGSRGWTVRLDDWLGDAVSVRDTALYPLQPGQWLFPGNRVIITAFLMRGVTGELVRPSRLLNGKRAWLIKLDKPFGGLRHTRVVASLLAPWPVEVN